MLTSYKDSQIRLIKCHPADLDLAVTDAPMTLERIARGFPLKFEFIANLSYFEMDTGLPLGWLVERGSVWHTPVAEDVLWPVVDLPGAADGLGIKFSIGPEMIRDGRVTNLAAEIAAGQFTGFDQWRVCQQTALCRFADGTWALVIATRLSMYNLAGYLLLAGATWAIKADGGGSTELRDGNNNQVFGPIAAKDHRRMLMGIVVRKAIQDAPHVASRTLQLATNFWEWEFRCRHCLLVTLDPRLPQVAQKYRDIVRRTVNVTSGWRCPEHNASPEVGGAADSQHLLGTAMDSWVAGMSVDAQAAAAKKAGFTGIGRYYKKGFIHADLGPARTWVG